MRSSTRSASWASGVGSAPRSARSRSNAAPVFLHKRTFVRRRGAAVVGCVSKSEYIKKSAPTRQSKLDRGLDAASSTSN